ncbi:hypothetical protein ACFUCH_03700 [Streptomyces olivaceus]|uniref:hypothetical protein n=1 Tax=Streptomyces olivaceus TaxID=47716 RepID=UPI003633817C
MKIIKGVEAGEQPSPRLHRRIAAEVLPVLAVHGTGSALWAGTRLLAGRGWVLLGRYLTGWEKPAAIVFAGYVAVHTAIQYPTVTQFAVPGAVIGWCVTAWWIAPPAPRAETGMAPATGDEPPPQLSLDALADVVRRVAGPRQGAHLAQLLDTPEFASWEQPDLKAEFLARGVPVGEFKLILDGRQRVRDGVRLRDLPPPAAPGPAPSPPAGPAPGARSDPAPHPVPDPAPGPE